MINPSDISSDVVVNTYTCFANTLSGVQSLVINPDRAYTVAHDGLDIANVVDVNQIIICTSGNPLSWANVNTSATIVKQMKLTSGKAVAVGPGVNVLTWIGTAGQPTFTVIPSERLYGHW